MRVSESIILVPSRTGDIKQKNISNTPTFTYKLKKGWSEIKIEINFILKE
jgi:hypothetical protein